ncbi:MAG: transcriptional regulator [Myxococcaceae bacterium]|jgi:CheY-like chemotaxis protein|nr:transcriptional regulator [Myxococcaceae bacterium]MEA2749285.1 two-component system, cell cycle response regulator DivK [Myxococcales bacterium]
MSAAKKSTTGSAPQPPLVLVVDDFEDNRTMYLEFLEFNGFRVAEAVNGQEAVDRAIELMPAVVVMDLSLPVMDGWEATRRLKANPKTKDIIVIALTGHAEAAHAKRARDAGCDDFVAKPCLPEELAAKVRAHVARAANGGKAPAKSATGRNKKHETGSNKKFEKGSK